jgi:uncharacterized protein (TIGR00369 family)
METLTQIWQEPVRGEYLDPRLARLSGAEQMQWYLDQNGPIPPIGRLTGLRYVATGVGRARFVLPLSGWLAGPKGEVHPGMYDFVADAALGCAVASLLPPQTGSTTAELSMTFLGQAPATGALVADADVIHCNGANALAQVRVVDDAGRLLAHGTSRYFLFPFPVSDDGEPSLQEMPDHDSPDPYERPPRGAVLTDDQLAGSGLSVLRDQVDGLLPLPPIHHLTGIRPAEATAGEATFAMPASEWLCNGFGNIYGGALALLGMRGRL